MRINLLILTIFLICSSAFISVEGIPKPINKCKISGTVAITFDDGPSDVTHILLDKLKALRLKATFFVNGHNFGCIYNKATASVLIRAMKEGHQIASHSWSHLDFATLNKKQIVYQVRKLEEALLKILGVIPKYFRLPFGSGADSALVMNTLQELNYTVVLWDIDSNDWRGFSTQKSLEAYKKASGPPAAHIALNHDTILNTVSDLGPRAFKLMKDRNFKIRTVGECLGVTDPKKWYQKIRTPKIRDSTWKCTNSDINGP